MIPIKHLLFTEPLINWWSHTSFVSLNHKSADSSPQPAQVARIVSAPATKRYWRQHLIFRPFTRLESQPMRPSLFYFFTIKTWNFFPSAQFEFIVNVAVNRIRSRLCCDARPQTSLVLRLIYSLNWSIVLQQSSQYINYVETMNYVSVFGPRLKQMSLFTAPWCFIN